METECIELVAEVPSGSLHLLETLKEKMHGALNVNRWKDIACYQCILKTKLIFTANL